MDFDLIFKIGGIVLAGGLLTTIYFYFKCRQDSPPGRAPSFARYFGIAILIGIVAYIVGTAVGIHFACSSPTSGNLCGLYGALGVGPLLSGLALLLYGLSWQSQSRASASAGAAMQTTAGRHAWTGHSFVRVVAGAAGGGLALYGATALFDGDGRGAAAAVVVGGVAVCWGLIGRLPFWFRP